ncbi:MAG: 2-hydroxyacyl-CoA dehydratase family protein [Actinomycetota bacterium]|nr:2-hydroxyacyl-CoA dehydratase family protein [Actinomycetota bacterium]
MPEEQEITRTIKKKINNTADFFKKSGYMSSSRPSVGWFCTYTPEELIIAGGFTPVRIFGRNKISRSESYFPINFCPYVKASWEGFLGDSRDFEGLIFTNSCDGMRRFFDIARRYLNDVPSHLLDIPHLKNKESLDFFAGNIKDTKIFIEKLRGKKITGSEIENAAAVVNNKRQLLKELQGFIRKFPHILNISTYYKIMELALVSDPESFLDDIRKYLDFLKKVTDENSSHLKTDLKKYPPIMIIGSFIAETKLWEILTEMDVRLAFDDLCTSGRYFENPIKLDKSKNLIESIASGYLNKPQCMRMADLGFKFSEIKNNIINNDIKGVMFMGLKFCDTMLYPFSTLKKELSDMGIPVLYLEIEYNNFSEGQIKTRMQAFLEML